MISATVSWSKDSSWFNLQLILNSQDRNVQTLIRQGNNVSFFGTYFAPFLAEISEMQAQK